MENFTAWEEDAVIVDLPYVEIEDEDDDDQIVIQVPRGESPHAVTASNDDNESDDDSGPDLEALGDLPEINSVTTFTESDEDPLDTSGEDTFSLFTDALQTTFDIGSTLESDVCIKVEGEERIAFESHLVLEESQTSGSDDRKRKSNCDNISSQPMISLWKFANPYGKFLMDGIKEGVEDTRKVLGIGVGQIRISLAEPENAIRIGDILKGKVHLELTEHGLETEALTINFQGVRQDPRGVPVVVCAAEQELRGLVSYTEGETVPFELKIPELHPEPLQEFVTWDRWLASALQLEEESDETSVEWSITATLRIPGRLSMKRTIQLEVSLDSAEM